MAHITGRRRMRVGTPAEYRITDCFWSSPRRTTTWAPTSSALAAETGSLIVSCAYAQDEHVGADFAGVPSMVEAAGGSFVAMYAEIGVGIAVSKDAAFSAKVFAADSRLHAVSCL